MLQVRLLNAEKCVVDEKWNYPGIISPFYRIYFALTGEASVFSNKKQYKLEPGFMYLIPAFTRNSYLCKNQFEHIYLHVTIEPENELPVFLGNGGISKAGFSTTEEFLAKRLLKLHPNKALHNYRPETYNEKNSSEDVAGRFVQRSVEIETQGILLQLLSRFVSDDQRQANGAVPLKIKLVMRHIEQNLDSKITVAALADKVCLTPDYFSKLFLKYVKRTPIEYINKKRIEKAQLLLITTLRSVKQIGYECGFENMAYFYRQFKKECDCTPIEYRTQHQQV